MRKSYSLVDELLAHLAGVQSTFGDAEIWWRIHGPQVDSSEYHDLSNSEFGRVAINLIEFTMNVNN